MISAQAFSLFSTSKRNSATRRGSLLSRATLMCGKITRTAPSVVGCFGLARRRREFLTMTHWDHSFSVPTWRGHHGKDNRVLLHDHPLVTAALPITRAFRSRVTASLL